MSEAEERASDTNVGRLPNQPRSTAVSDELGRLATLLRGVCPRGADIEFQFDTKLRVHIDVRELEHVVALELILPTLGAGVFHDIQRGQTPHHSFMHRVTALVDR